MIKKFLEKKFLKQQLSKVAEVFDYKFLIYRPIDQAQSENVKMGKAH